MADVITVEHLTVAFPAREGAGEVVRDVSLAIGAGERVGLVVVTAFASVFAGLLGGSRVPFNAARDRVFFGVFGRTLAC